MIVVCRPNNGESPLAWPVAVHEAHHGREVPRQWPMVLWVAIEARSFFGIDFKLLARFALRAKGLSFSHHRNRATGQNVSAEMQLYINSVVGWLKYRPTVQVIT